MPSVRGDRWFVDELAHPGSDSGDRRGPPFPPSISLRATVAFVRSVPTFQEGRVGGRSIVGCLSMHLIALSPLAGSIDVLVDRRSVNVTGFPCMTGQGPNREPTDERLPFDDSIAHFQCTPGLQEAVVMIHSVASTKSN
jgi:hypothetical protein